jgi:hypothetical protein
VHPEILSINFVTCQLAVTVKWSKHAVRLTHHTPGRGLPAGGCIMIIMTVRFPRAGPGTGESAPPPASQAPGPSPSRPSRNAGLGQDTGQIWQFLRRKQLFKILALQLEP